MAASKKFTAKEMFGPPPESPSKLLPSSKMSIARVRIA